MLGSHGDTDGVLGGTGGIALVLRELLVGCRPRVDGEGLGVTDAVGKLLLADANENENIEEHTWRDWKST